MEKPIKYVKITKVDYFMHLLSKLNECYDKAIELGDEDTRMEQYGSSLEALKGLFTSDEDRYKVVKNLAYIARADDFIHDNEMAMVEQAVSELEMVDKVKLVKTDSTLFVDPTF